MSIHSKKLKLKYWTIPCQERFKFGAGDPVLCKTGCFLPVLIHGACAVMRVSVVPGKLMLLIGKDTHTEGIVNGELVNVWRKVKKNRTDARTALVTHRWYGPAIVVGKEKNNVFVSYRGRVTKVAPECVRKASVAQMSWDITTKEKALFEIALDEENLSWEEPLLDESGEFLDTEMPNTAVERANLEEEVNSPVNDDGALPVSETLAAENDDHSEDETQSEEPDPVTEESRDLERDQLRRRLTQKQPRSMERWPEPSPEKEKGMESRLTRHASTCLSCCTVRFSRKQLDPKKSNGIA